MVAITVGCFTAEAQPNTELRPDETVLLYADSFENEVDPVYGKKITYAGFEMNTDNKITQGETITDKGNIGNISKYARVDLYFPKNPNGQMVVICPGGGYVIVSSYNEGLYAASWFLERDITVAVVKYRLPNKKSTCPHEDVENAFRYCRANAKKWGINQIGVMGFSAGGHLAATTSTLWTEEQTRPDFSILIYPVISMEIGVTHKGTREHLLPNEGVWKPQMAEKYSLENQITRFTPTTFLAHCTDDTAVPVENSLRYYKELIQNGVQAEMHIWPKGGHGWGFFEEQYVGVGNDKFVYAREDYYRNLENWLKRIR